MGELYQNKTRDIAVLEVTCDRALGRGSDAEEARKRVKNKLYYQPTSQPIDQPTEQHSDLCNHVDAIKNAADHKVNGGKLA